MLRVFGLLGIVITVGTIALLAVKTISSVNGGNVKQPVNNAAAVKEKTDLDALETKLNAYFVEKGGYPTSLDQLDQTGIGAESFTYTFCSSTLVAVKTQSTSKIILENGAENPSAAC